MALGQKIKQARLEAGLSQRQLCGDEITRNMLSQIENGSARPSMDTLSYFARRLGKPMSWFLEEDTVSSPNARAVVQARQAYAAGDCARAVELLEACRESDELLDGERWLLEAMSLLGLAKQVLAQGKDVYARSLLERAALAGHRSPYFTQPLQRELVLTMYQAQPEKAPELELPIDDRELYLRAEVAMAAGEYEKSAAILEAACVKDAHWHFLRGRAALEKKDYALAAQHYLQAEERYPMPCAQALEQCYRELEVYKMAYYYACKQR